MPNKPIKLKQGFAALSSKRRIAIARLGGKAHSREHLARIGAKGGAARKSAPLPDNT